MMNQKFNNKVKLIYNFIDKHKREDKKVLIIITYSYLQNVYVIKLKIK